MRSVIILFLFPFALMAQQNVLVLGNHESLCLDEEYDVRDSLPDSIDQYKVILFFSGSTSQLTERNLETIVDFMERGGGLYSGAENWPLQAESNQITQRLYRKESFGNYEETIAEANVEAGNLRLDDLDAIPSGNTTVAFPMDYRLRVEAWVEDQPLILTGQIGNGRIIIDGGYSRFYCMQRTPMSDQLFQIFLRYLRGH